MKKRFILILNLLSFSVLISLIAAGCASQEINTRQSLSGYEAFELSPVSNETGETFDFDVAWEIEKRLALKLSREGFKVDGTSGRTLIIKSSLTSYETRVAGTASCTVKSMLIDKNTGMVIDQIVTTASVSAGGLPQLGLKPESAVLDVVADKIVGQIERRMRSGKHF